MKFTEVLLGSLSLGGIAAPVLLLGVVLLAGVVTPGYDPIRETISRMAITGKPYAVLVNTGFVIYGLFMAGFIYAMHAKLPGIGGKLIMSLLAIHALAIGLLAVFHDRASDGQLTLTSLSHNLCALVSYWSLTVAILLFAVTQGESMSWQSITPVSLGLALLAALFPLVFLFDFSKALEGLLQRLNYAIPLAWLPLLALRCLQLNR